MATAKNEAKTVRLEHKNGAVVEVPEGNAARLLAGGLFTKSTSTRRAKKSTGDADS